MAEENKNDNIPQEVNETPQEVTETPQTEQEAPQTPSSHDYVYGKMREMYPDHDFDGDEGGYGAVQKYIDETSGQISRFRENESRLNDILNRSEMSGLMFAAMCRGENPIAFLMESFGPKVLEDIQSEEGRKALADAQQKFQDRLEQNVRDQQEWDDNIGKSLQILDDFAAKHNLTPEQKAAVFDKIWSFGGKAILGTYDEEDFELGMKALNYDQDVDVARQKGEVAGRNAKIDMKLRKSRKLDSMPTSMDGGSAGSEKEDERRPLSFEERNRRDPWGLAAYVNNPH